MVSYSFGCPAADAADALRLKNEQGSWVMQCASISRRATARRAVLFMVSAVYWTAAIATECLAAGPPAVIVYDQVDYFTPDDVNMSSGQVILLIRNLSGVTREYTITRTR